MKLTEWSKRFKAARIQRKIQRRCDHVFDRIGEQFIEMGMGKMIHEKCWKCKKERWTIL